MELNISNIDIVVILLFVVGIIWWALKNRKNENASEYFSRKISKLVCCWVLFVCR